MPVDLNSLLESWLEKGGLDLEQKIDEEIDNRVDHYPRLHEILHRRPIDIPHFTAEALECWVLDRFRKMRLNAFARHQAHAQELIAYLIDALPEHPVDIASHIDNFIDEAVVLGFVNEKGSRDLAGAAALASIVLSARYPDVFVDYPSQKRWRNFVQLLGYTLPDFDTHGQRLVWVSEFAQNLATQRIFRLKWPRTESMWVISALCWASGRTDEIPDRTDLSAAAFEQPNEYVSPEYLALSLAELRQKALSKVSMSATPQERQINYYIRSQAVKAYALQRAGEICEGCKKPAPFRKPSGEPYLEVHHIERLADGGPDTLDAVIALCPNCHRKAHYAANAAQFNQELRKRVEEIESGMG